MRSYAKFDRKCAKCDGVMKIEPFCFEYKCECGHKLKLVAILDQADEYPLVSEAQ